jgi:hypothetical protein
MDQHKFHLALHFLFVKPRPETSTAMSKPRGHMADLSGFALTERDFAEYRTCLRRFEAGRE